MYKLSAVISAMLLGLSLTAEPVWAQSNPVDRVSNPNALDYTDVEVSPREMNPPFVRHGLVVEPQRLASIKAGLSGSEVTAVLGEPLRKNGVRDEWDYDVKLKMPQSDNYLICQYKIVFGQQDLVSETVWRRRQCAQIASQQPASLRAPG
ncbi:outer membrane protein assembly factor BamE domain-containing protein [Brevundimonas diminuta]|uniref:outer membrane protein assembly factor BamE domain-containing protein n=1 Tax=Brevundimonas diminuta TaxID=293 RepID=UPI0032086B1D